MIKLHLNVQKKIDPQLLSVFQKQASSVSNYLAHRPLPIELHDGQYAAIFASQRWTPMPGFETYDTRYIGTHRCLIELHLCLVSKPKHRSQQAQAIKCIQKAQNFQTLLPALQKLCHNTSVKVNLSQKRDRS